VPRRLSSASNRPRSVAPHFARRRAPTTG
jgi:hypothetical protein